MGIGTLTPWTTPQAITHTRLNDIQNVLLGDFVGRNASGVATAGQNLGNSVYPWGSIYADSLVLDGSLIDLSSVLSSAPYKILSGSKRATSNQPAYLDPAGSGSGRSLTVKGTVTNLVAEIAGTTTTVALDITVSSLTAAPSSQNTATLVKSVASAQEDSRVYGEGIDTLGMSSVGTNITALVGKRAAFKITNGGNTEYFLATVKDSTTLADCWRGFFTDSSLAPMNRIKIANGDPITLMKLGWLFLDSDGTTIDAVYNEPVFSGAQPSGPSSGDYWFDLSTSTWKLYNGAIYVETDRMLLGMFFCDASDCLGVRCADFYATYQPQNSMSISWASASVVEAQSIYQKISVAGNLIEFGNTRPAWDMASDLASSSDLYTSTEQASRRYYFYVTDLGEKKISDISPYYRPDLFGYYHPHNPWRCVGSALNNGSSNFLDPALASTPDTDFISKIEQIKRNELPGIGMQVSSASGSFSVTGASETDVTNLSATITTKGRPVIIGLVWSGTGVGSMGMSDSAASNVTAQFRIKRDSTTVAYHQMKGDASTFTQLVPLFAIMAIDIVAAGTYTYKMTANGIDGNCTAYVNNAKLVAFELA